MSQLSLRPLAAVAALVLLSACHETVTGFRDTPVLQSASVGDVIPMNVNPNEDCTNPIIHPMRVEAITAQAIVLNDTLNPPNGFVTADFQRIGAKFDTLIYPLDVSAFGQPTDIDQNGRIALLFTRAVNQETPANSTSYVGGFTYSRDLFPHEGSAHAAACASSNQGEMFYMLVPDPTGSINGNARSKQFAEANVPPVIAHEFQHLINASRRLYVNTNSLAFEARWLDEGLAHVAEELLFYHESGYTARGNLGTAQITATSTTYGAYQQDMTGNAGRYKVYLGNPMASSPYADNDDLSTRGAAWSLLRYLADARVLGTAPSAPASTRRVGSGSVTIPATTTQATYAAVVVNGSLNPGLSTAFNIQASNIILANLIPTSPNTVASRSILAVDGPANGPALDHTFEAALRARERRMMATRAGYARSWYAATRAPSTSARRVTFDAGPGTSVDGDVWYRLVNNIDTGVVNLQGVLGIDMPTAIRNWSVSNQADDAAVAVPPEFQQPSWNWHDIYTSISGTAPYPLIVRTIGPNIALTGSVIGGGAAYFRLTVPAGTSASVTLGDLSGAQPSTLQLVVVRTQ